MSMLYIDKLDPRLVSFQMDDVKIKFVNKDKTLWFTKKELADFFELEKAQIKKTLSDIHFDTIIIWWKKKKYYSLNKVIILWYRLKKFKQTKILNLINMYVKVQSIDGSVLTRVRSSAHSQAYLLKNVVNI